MNIRLPFIRPRAWSPGGLSAVWLLSVLLGLVSARTSPANFTLIDFENNPKHAVGPKTFNPSANPETLTALTGGTTKLATITGGVVLGNPNFVASFPGTNGSAPNAYGTAFFAPNLASSLTITFDPGVTVSEVTGSVFNDRGDIASYEVLAYRSSGSVLSDVLPNLPVNLDPASSARWNLKAGDGSRITSIEIHEIAPDDGAYDFLIDNVGVTYTVPEPGALTLSVLGGSIVLARAARSSTSRRSRPGADPSGQ